MTGWLDALVELVSTSAWTYLLVGGIAGLDAVFPIVPGETMVITAGVLASNGGLSITLVIVCGGLGAFIGDNAGYQIGRSLEARATRRFFAGPKGLARLEWGRRSLAEYGGPLLLVARFIPGGRTAVTVGAGIVGFPRRTFIVYDAIACTIWATFAGLLGFIGGQAFKEQPWKGLVIGLAVSAVVSVLGELWRRRRERRRVGPPAEPPA